MMIRSRLTTLIPALALSALAMASLSAAAAPGDDTPPPNSAPGADAPRNGPHHDAAWQACNKQADDQNISARDARREFMRSCMKAAKEASPPPSS
jgi:hypothetical protein